MLLAVLVHLFSSVPRLQYHYLSLCGRIIVSVLKAYKINLFLMVRIQWNTLAYGIC
jgi:hypothetical protein